MSPRHDANLALSWLDDARAVRSCEKEIRETQCESGDDSAPMGAHATADAALDSECTAAQDI